MAEILSPSRHILSAHSFDGVGIGTVHSEPGFFPGAGNPLKTTLAGLTPFIARCYSRRVLFRPRVELDPAAEFFVFALSDASSSGKHPEDSLPPFRCDLRVDSDCTTLAGSIHTPIWQTAVDIEGIRSSCQTRAQPAQKIPRPTSQRRSRSAMAEGSTPPSQRILNRSN